MFFRQALRWRNPFGWQTPLDKVSSGLTAALRGLISNSSTKRSPCPSSTNAPSRLRRARKTGTPYFAEPTASERWSCYGRICPSNSSGEPSSRVGTYFFQQAALQNRFLIKAMTSSINIVTNVVTILTADRPERRWIGCEGITVCWVLCAFIGIIGCSEGDYM